MTHTHSYELLLRWTGNRGVGTCTYRAYSRNHDLVVAGAPVIPGSADPVFRGDAARWNPELLFLASLAQCHMLTYLHLATGAGVVVTAYEDRPTGVLTMDPDGIGGEMTQVTLRPSVTITPDSDPDVAQSLHEQVGALCFIARSVRVPVHHEPTVRVGDD